MTLNPGMFSSKTAEWATPQYVFDHFHREFRFNLDVCATPENAKCGRYFSLAEDALKQSWCGNCWMNPPYGRGIGSWVEKAFHESLRGGLVVALLPARTDTKWWHEYVMQSSEIRFLRGRLYFGDGTGRAPFPSCVVVFNGLPWGHTKISSLLIQRP